MFHGHSSKRYTSKVQRKATHSVEHDANSDSFFPTLTAGVIAARHAPLVERGNSDVAAIRSARGSSVASARASASGKVAKVGGKAKPAVGTVSNGRKVKAFNPYSKNSKFMKSKAVKYVTSFRCRSNAQCNAILSSVFPTDNGVPVAQGICQPGSRTCSVSEYPAQILVQSLRDD